MKDDPIYYPCHTCHADPGEPCRRRDGYCLMRQRVVKNKDVSAWVTVVHAKVHGEMCKDWDGICSICGQKIERLKKIPEVLSGG